LEASVWAQLRYTEEMERRGVPLKRSVLIHGPFGTGKTLAAGITGQIATHHGWTYIKARPGRDNFLSVLQTARLYQPAVVFCEDVDTISDPSENEATITRLLDDFDGIDAKNTRILCVLTTNHPERIHKGMLRPGRLDAVVKIDALDHDGIEAMIKACVDDDLLDSNIDWQVVGDAMEHFKPAFVREAADRAVRYSVVRGGGTASTVLNTDDLKNAANGLRPQLDMMEGASDTAKRDTMQEALLRAVDPLIVERTTEAVRGNVREDLLAPLEEPPAF
jgi:ATP-dependent 26S proteasome regulatory subunit